MFSKFISITSIFAASALTVACSTPAGGNQIQQISTPEQAISVLSKSGYFFNCKDTDSISFSPAAKVTCWGSKSYDGNNVDIYLYKDKNALSKGVSGSKSCNSTSTKLVNEQWWLDAYGPEFGIKPETHKYVLEQVQKIIGGKISSFSAAGLC